VVQELLLITVLTATAQTICAITALKTLA
jgi:hypothetical protein